MNLIEHLLVFNGCKFLQRNQYSLNEKYLRYIEYFQEGNGILGCHLMFSDWNVLLQTLCLTKCFLLTKTYKYGILNTGLLLIQYWFLGTIWTGSIQYLTKTGGYK